MFSGIIVAIHPLKIGETVCPIRVPTRIIAISTGIRNPSGTKSGIVTTDITMVISMNPMPTMKRFLFRTRFERSREKG
ncbi:MAG: hypothetical protein B1H02_06205 [Candidatus Latescibacteria bacterium 4484_107]|nr:MAG: hypothetical protein B1H02_06205 [Candidatus Latescibacteria bacterium 4484_107]